MFIHSAGAGCMGEVAPGGAGPFEGPRAAGTEPGPARGPARLGRGLGPDPPLCQPPHLRQDDVNTVLHNPVGAWDGWAARIISKVKPCSFVGHEVCAWCFCYFYNIFYFIISLFGCTWCSLISLRMDFTLLSWELLSTRPDLRYS